MRAGSGEWGQDRVPFDSRFTGGPLLVTHPIIALTMAQKTHKTTVRDDNRRFLSRNSKVVIIKPFKRCPDIPRNIS